MTDDPDIKFLSYALNLTHQNLGLTAPNPVVGCVIVKNGKIISAAVTAPGGRPHAEKIAIDKISDPKILNGSTLYVTLEPCAHHGQTAPCLDEIIKYRFKKVVIAIIDPDPRVNGKSIKKLREAGIKVVYSPSKELEKEAQEINRGFFKARLTSRPFITLKLATSLDGKIATKNFDSKWITNEKTRKFAHYLRSINDAILIGSGTLKKDNPMLNCRISGLEKFSPKRVVITSNPDFDSNLQIFQTAKKSTTMILTNRESSGLTNLGAKVILCAEKNGQIDLFDALQKLCLNGINSVLVEGGKYLATQFLLADLVDELVLMRSNKIIGEDGISIVGTMDCAKVSTAINLFSRKKVKEFAGDLLEILQKN